MTILVWKTASFLIGDPVTPVLRRDVIRAPVPPAAVSGTTVVAFVPSDEKAGVVPSDPKPGAVR